LRKSRHGERSNQEPMTKIPQEMSHLIDPFSGLVADCCC
jgi:hypothetical protein